MTYEGVPGLVRTKDAHNETTLVVDTPRLREACLHLRDEHGFNVLADIAAADYLGWNDRRVAGYWGTAGGRDINSPGSWGLHKTPEPKPKRFSVSYHLLSVQQGKGRLRLQEKIKAGVPPAYEIRGVAS